MPQCLRKEHPSQAAGTACAKALRLECAWQVSETAKRPVRLSQSEGAGRVGIRDQTCRFLSTTVGPWFLFGVKLRVSRRSEQKTDML